MVVMLLVVFIGALLPLIQASPKVREIPVLTYKPTCRSCLGGTCTPDTSNCPGSQLSLTYPVGCAPDYVCCVQPNRCLKNGGRCLLVGTENSGPGGTCFTGNVETPFTKQNCGTCGSGDTNCNVLKCCPRKNVAVCTNLGGKCRDSSDLCLFGSNQGTGASGCGPGKKCCIHPRKKKRCNIAAGPDDVNRGCFDSNTGCPSGWDEVKTADSSVCGAGEVCCAQY